MKEFNIAKNFKQINVSGKRHVESLIAQIPKKNIENNIILNLEDCQTDYPETPKLIDHFLFALSKKAGQKQLTILFNGLATKEVFVLYDIILEGDFFGIHEKKDTDNELSEWKKVINNKLNEFDICLLVKSTADDSKIFHYGGKIIE